MQKTVHELVRQKESEYSSGTPTQISKYVSFSLYENNNKIEAYINSQHVSGKYDSLNRRKPFFNVSTAVRNIWYRATDIDRKDIRLKATKQKQYVQTLLANIILQEWMRKTNFGAWLNQWGRTLADYGSAMTRWDIKDGELIPSVTPWSRLIVDNVDVDADIKIEKLYLSPAQLRSNKSFDQDKVEELLTALTTRKDQNGQNKDAKNIYIELYKVEGEMELAQLTDDWEKDGKTYQQQIHIVSFIAPERLSNKQEYQDFTLYRGKEGKDPNYITHLIKEDGRATAIGAIESVFESQWMSNHIAKAMKDILDLASKIILQTSDDSFIGRNAITNIENGDVLITKPNQPLTQLNNAHDTTSLQNFLTEWQNLAKEISSTPDALRGTTLPSGTPYALGSLLSQQGQSLFEIMIENKAMHLEEILRRYVIPYIKTKLDNADEVAAILDEEGIARIDSIYIPNEAVRRYNQMVKDKALALDTNIPTYQDMQPQMEAQVKNELTQAGNQRFFSPGDISWKELFKDFEWEPEVEISGETTDKNALFTTLGSVLQSVVQASVNPAISENPTYKLVLSRILNETGIISPIELANATKPVTGMPTPQMTAPPSPIGGSNAGGGLPAKSVMQ